MKVKRSLNEVHPFLTGTIGDVPCILLARHGRKHDIMPSDVNFRANLWGMHSLGMLVL